MSWNLKGSAVIKADKDYKAGDEIQVSTEFKADQADLDRMAAERISREKVKQSELEAQLKKANEDLEVERKKTATPPPAGGGVSPELQKLIDDQKKISEETQKQLRETREKLTLAEQRSQIEAKLKAQELELPSTYRNSIKVGLEATEAEIDAEIARVKKAYEAEVPESARKKKIVVGTPGNGGPPQNTDGEASLTKLKKNRKDLLFTINSMSLEKQQEIALKWDKEGKLEPKAA